MNKFLDNLAEWMMAFLIVFGYPIVAWILYFIAPYLPE